MATSPSPAQPQSTISEGFATISQEEIEHLVALELQMYRIEKELNLKRRSIAQRLREGATVEIGRFAADIWRNTESLEFLRFQDLKKLASVCITCLSP